MKKALIIIGTFVLSLFLVFAVFVTTFAIYDTQPEDCTVVNVTVKNIIEGSTYDIVFRNAHHDGFYINRGLEQGLILDSLRAKVLNKTVTLHLAKLPVGTSSHISQLALGDEIIFTEFK